MGKVNQEFCFQDVKVEMTKIERETLNRQGKGGDKHVGYSAQEISLDLGFIFTYRQQLKPSQESI